MEDSKAWKKTQEFIFAQSEWWDQQIKNNKLKSDEGKNESKSKVSNY